MRDAGGHFADRGQARLNRGIPFELSGVGDILEGDQQAGLSAGHVETRRRGTTSVRTPVCRRGEPRCGPASTFIAAGGCGCRGSCNTSSMGRPTAAWNVTPVIVSAA
jgi:hypothetical protein